MYAVKINVGSNPEVIDMKSFDFPEVARRINCEYIQPISVEVNGRKFVVLADEEGKCKENYTYTGFIGTAVSDKAISDYLVNSYLIVKHQGTGYRGLVEKDLQELSNRIMIIDDPNGGHWEQTVMNFTKLSNDDLAEELMKD